MWFLDALIPTWKWPILEVKIIYLADLVKEIRTLEDSALTLEAVDRVDLRYRRA